MLALLPALLTATALLATLASGLLLLLAGLLLAALLTALLLPALLHIAHLVVRHGEFSFAEGFRATTILWHQPWFRSGQMRLAEMPEQGSERVVSPNYPYPSDFTRSASAESTSGNGQTQSQFRNQFTPPNNDAGDEPQGFGALRDDERHHAFSRARINAHA